MSVTFGFYNSVSNDRKYNAEQMSSLFDGIINDGVFASIGTALVVLATSGMGVSIGIGRAWFNSTWTNNDAILPLTVSQSEVVLNRIDAVVLEVNSDNAVRLNSFKIIKGTPATVPVQPVMVQTATTHQYPLCYIYVAAGAIAITQANITNKVGTSAFPFITGILATVNIDTLLTQWDLQFSQWFTASQSVFNGDVALWTTEFNTWFASSQDLFTGDIAQWTNQFNTWFAAMQGMLSGDIAANLALQITTLKGTGWINETVKGNAAALIAHEADYVRNAAYGPATGSVNAYTFSAMPATAYVDGMSVYLDNTVATNTGAATFNWSGLGIKAIVDSKGVALIPGKMPLNCIVGLRFNASAAAGVGNFQLLGEGGDYGTAGAAQTLSPYTVGTPNGVIGGTMLDLGATGLTPSTVAVTIPAGYRNGSGVVAPVTSAIDPDIIPGNILKDKNILGVVGTVVPAGSQLFNSSGTFTPPPGVTKVFVTIVSATGGGGGGGGAAGTTPGPCGSVNEIFSLTPAGNGVAGGITSFGSYASMTAAAVGNGGSGYTPGTGYNNGLSGDYYWSGHTGLGGAGGAIGGGVGGNSLPTGRGGSGGGGHWPAASALYRCTIVENTPIPVTVGVGGAGGAGGPGGVGTSTTGLPGNPGATGTSGSVLIEW